MSDQFEFVAKVQEVGISVGLALDLKTAISEIDPNIIKDLDIILLMSVPAGFVGQQFDDKVIKKIKELAALRSKNHLSFKIHLDGGVKPEKINTLEDLGVDEVSIGKHVFKGDF